MLIQKNPALHLTYCLNVHPGERWDEHFAAIRDKARSIHRRVSPKRAFGLGLRISGQAAGELQAAERLDELKRYLAENQLYVFTINGFPWGRFHGEHVKEQVYKPDWRTRERLAYTIQLADILRELLPEGVTGSISTVPGSYRPWIKWEGDTGAMVNRLLDCVAHLHGIFLREGKLIQLAIEPEPGCALETTDEFITFLTRRLMPSASARGLSEESVLRHVGLCLDTCHLALQYENLIGAVEMCREEGVQIAKVQVSAALRCKASREAMSALEPFAEPVYLHQVRARRTAGGIVSWSDLAGALHDLPRHNDMEELRVHYHVPLFWDGSGALKSTADQLTPAFFDTLQSGATSHLEIETYTFDVLPPELKSAEVVDSIVREYEWVLARLKA